MKARDIMTAQPTVVTPDESITRVAEIMEHIDVGMVPVVDSYHGMHPEGVITDRDLTLRHVARSHGPECTVADHMTKDRLDSVRPDDPVHDVIDRMKHDQVRRMLVVDNTDRLIGVIALADIARKVGPAEPKLIEQLIEGVSLPSTRSALD